MQTHAYIYACMYLEVRIAKKKGRTTSCSFDFFFVQFSRDLKKHTFTHIRSQFAFTQDASLLSENARTQDVYNW